MLNSCTYSTTKKRTNLGYRVKKHQSVLIRRLGNVDRSLQYNKVDNLGSSFAASMVF